MNTRFKVSYLLAATAALLATSRLSADLTAGQVVDINVPVVNLIALTGGDTSITVTEPGAGAVVGYNADAGFTNTAHKLKCTTNDPDAKKITVEIDSDITNATLKVEVTTAVTGSNLAGKYSAVAAASTTPQALFDDFSYVATDPINAAGLQVQYTFKVPNTNLGATFVADSVDGLTVTYTIADH